ncbi:DUF1499 domain-containing protein [Rosistilla oblonga]|uniref:DUF1499 domain-containing protein n=1 Tax=Rosistilla oblonga TaxID=2527990 RepID=A0A518IYL8_9BACT|nr:DUF1499 domain-containing protein [Rosistilla oblonga]QDV58182.1 hypothetical protein Mal33_41990 [Rosistilla oblonga]
MGIAIGAIVLLVTGWIFWQVDDWSRDFTTNHAQLDPAADDPLLRPVLAAESVGQLAARVLSFVETTPHWQVERQRGGPDGTELHLTRTTSLFRYVDDIQVRISPVDGGAQLDAESQSRLGKGDLGQNPRNLKELVRGIDGFPSLQEPR